MCVYQNGSDYLLFAASMMCAHFNYKTPDRREAAAAGWSPLSVKINLSPVFVSSRILSVPCNFRIHLTLSSSSRATTAATPRQLRGPPADSSFEPSSFVRFLVFSAPAIFHPVTAASSLHVMVMLRCLNHRRGAKTLGVSKHFE